MQKYELFPTAYQYGPYIIVRTPETNNWRWKKDGDRGMWSTAYPTSAMAKRAIDIYERRDEEPASVPEVERYDEIAPRHDKIDYKDYIQEVQIALNNNAGPNTMLMRMIFNFTLLLADKINEK